MLRHLAISNYALIDSLELHVPAGLTIITGETGAGKSILLGALGLLLGQRADSQALLDHDRKCVVEGTFAIANYMLGDWFAQHDLDYAEQTVIRREITPEGKSRAFINDTPVNLTTLKNLSEQLVDVHSQHETLTLNDAAFQLQAIDALAGHTTQVDQYKTHFRRFRKTEQEWKVLTEQETQAKKELNYFQFQFEELEQLQLKTGEQTEAETDLETLEHAETIKSGLSRVHWALDGSESNILASLNELRQTLAGLSKYNPKIAALHERLQASQIELKDLAFETSALEEEIVHDPSRMEKLRERLDAIYRLQQKHSVKTVDELIDLRQELHGKIMAIDSLEEQVEKLKIEAEIQKKKLTENAGKLSKKRLAAAPDLSKEIQSMLSEMGMPNAVLKIEHEVLAELKESGLDKITFLFSANKGASPQPLHKVASGGELSRLMLALKALLAKHTALPTIIFDEIDTGISGDVAAKTGAIMERMAGHLQVIAITHLP
ncbi:MAG: DNA repair protein RecN, partial [Bacteroidia bacterium]